MNTIKTKWLIYNSNQVYLPGILGTTPCTNFLILLSTVASSPPWGRMCELRKCQEFSIIYFMHIIVSRYNNVLYSLIQDHEVFFFGLYSLDLPFQMSM